MLAPPPLAKFGEAGYVRVSQLGADEFIMRLFPAGSDSGKLFYLDIGSADGEAISNTVSLDRLGWSGVCVDPFPKNMQSRTCTVVNKAISKDGKPRLFAKALEFGGFDDSLGVHREQPFVAAADRVTVETATMGDVLAESGAPPTIHYLNIDTEGSELEILRSFPFDKHSVHCITLEHNYEEPKRSEMHALLTSESNGFLLAYSVDWDDWYVHRSMQAQLQVLYDTVMPAPQKAS